MSDDVEPDRQWTMFAGLREGPNGPEFADFYSNPCGVQMHGYKEVHSVTLIEDPEGQLLGWLDVPDAIPAKNGISMVQHHKIFEIQFPYGSKTEVEVGKGEVVRVRVEIRDSHEGPPH